jgi:hypothetical protein
MGYRKHMNNENNNKEKKELRDQVLSAIKSGHVKMRPKWHFVLRAALFATGAILLFLVLLYLVSFIIFSLRQTGVWFVPLFGSRGWFVFFRLLPWLLVLLAIIFAGILELLVRHYSFAYRKPLLYSVVGIVVIVAIGGVLTFPLHRAPFRSARENSLPFAGPLYRGFGLQRFNDVHRGTVTAISTDGFILEDVGGETSSVMITPRTHLPLGSDFETGDLVIVFGNQSGTVVDAFGAQKITE